MVVGISPWCWYLYCEISTTSWTRDLLIENRFSFNTSLLLTQNTKHTVDFKLYLGYPSILQTNIFLCPSIFLIAPPGVKHFAFQQNFIIFTAGRKYVSVTSFLFVFSQISHSVDKRLKYQNQYNVEITSILHLF